jgi:hypothetical protein
LDQQAGQRIQLRQQQPPARRGLHPPGRQALGGARAAWLVALRAETDHLS